MSPKSEIKVCSGSFRVQSVFGAARILASSTAWIFRARVLTNASKRRGKEIFGLDCEKHKNHEQGGDENGQER